MNRKGWCPSLFAPMQSGDGWLTRVQPRRGRLSAADAISLADAAGRHGNGIIELTNRGNLQIRGLSPASAELFARDIIAAGARTGSDQAGHNLLVSPLAGADRAVHPQTAEIADAMEAALAGAGDLDPLPDKFLIAVDGGGAACLHDIRADIAVRAQAGQWAIWIDGEPLGAACAGASVAEAVLGLARAFAAKAGGARRMRDLVRSAGSHPVFQAAGLLADLPQSQEAQSHGAAPDLIGFTPLDGDRGGFGLGIPFGHMNAASLRRLAALSERFGDAILRLMPWRSVVIAGVAIGDAAALGAAASGFIADPADPRRHIIACTGQPRCPAATVDTHADAALLAAIHLSGRVHVSGCAKGCAHPGPAPVTLVGERGTYALIRNGGPGDKPDHDGLTMAQAVHILAAAR